MKKIFALFVALTLALMPIAFAADVDIQEDATFEGRARTINVGDGLDVSVANGAATVTLGDTTGDVTFQSTLLANGRAGGASTMSSSSTYISAAGLAYGVIQKRIGGGGGLDASPGSTLPNGTPGQELLIQITAVQSGGSWVVRPTHGTFSSLTFDTVGDNAVLLYDGTLGWIVKSQSGCTVAYPQLP